MPYNKYRGPETTRGAGYRGSNQQASPQGYSKYQGRSDSGSSYTGVSRQRGGSRPSRSRRFDRSYGDRQAFAERRSQAARIRERRYGQTRYGDRQAYLDRMRATQGSGLPPLSEHEAFTVAEKRSAYGAPHTGGPTPEQQTSFLNELYMSRRNPYYYQAQQRALDRIGAGDALKRMSKDMYAGLEGELPPLDQISYAGYGGYGGYAGYGGYGGYGGRGGGGGGGGYGSFDPIDYGQAVEQEGRTFGEGQQLTLWNI